MTAKPTGLMVTRKGPPAPIFSGYPISAYEIEQAIAGTITEVADPSGGGRQTIQFRINNEDIPIPTNPRAQLLSPKIFVPGRKYKIIQPFYIPSGLPTFSAGHFFQLYELYGPPYKGPAPVSLKIGERGSEGFNVLYWQRNERYSFDVPFYLGAVKYDHWYTMELRLLFSEEGWIEQVLDGEQIVYFRPSHSYNPGHEPETTKLAMKVRDESDNTGNCEWIIQQYRELGMIAGFETVDFGKALIYDIT